MKKKIKEKKGEVISDKMNKTRIVFQHKHVKHPIYGKIILKKKKYYVHDEKNLSKIGDFVKIMESRPFSKKKKWIITKILKKKK
jgi:small subunit ribosomal protein S17